MTDSADDAGLLEQSATAATAVERARVLGFDLPAIQGASRRLRIASLVILALGIAAIVFAFLSLPEPDLKSAALAFVLGFAAPTFTFVLAQIIVRLLSPPTLSAMAIATAGITGVVSSLLLLGAVALAPDDAAGFCGLLLGAWATLTIETSGHAAFARAFDRHNPQLATSVRAYREYPAWATIAAGRMLWVLAFAVVAALTGVAALLAFRFAAPIAIPIVLVVLALASLAEGWATSRDRLAVRVVVALLALAGVFALWLFLP